jgi:hypothetical protein
MKKILLIICCVCVYILQVQAQGSMPLQELKLAGTWHVDSVSFKRPVDLNGDGVKNANAVNEYSACRRVQLMTFSGDYTAEISSGKGVEGCKEDVMKYKQWILEKKVDEGEKKKYDNAKDKKGLKKPEKNTYLTLKDEYDDDNIEFLVISLTKDELQVVGYLTMDDSSELALIVWKKGEK